MDKKLLVKQFLLGFVVYFALTFMSKYFSEKEPLEKSLIYSGLQSLVFNFIMTAIFVITNKKKQ